MSGEGRKKLTNSRQEQIIATKTPAEEVEEKRAQQEKCTSTAGDIMGPIILCNTLSRAKEHASMYDGSQSASFILSSGSSSSGSLRIFIPLPTSIFIGIFCRR
jgi:hypothetical protein